MSSRDDLSVQEALWERTPWNRAQLLAAALGALPHLRVFPTVLLELIGAHLDYVQLLLPARGTGADAGFVYVAFAPGVAFDSTLSHAAAADAQQVGTGETKAAPQLRRAVASPTSIMLLAAPPRPFRGILARVDRRHLVDFPPSPESGGLLRRGATRSRNADGSLDRLSAPSGDSLTFRHTKGPGAGLRSDRSVSVRVALETGEWTGPSVPRYDTSDCVGDRQWSDGTAVAWRDGRLALLEPAPTSGAAPVAGEVYSADKEAAERDYDEYAWRVMEEITLPPLPSFVQTYFCLDTPRSGKETFAGDVVERTIVIVHERSPGALSVYSAPLPTTTTAGAREAATAAGGWRTAAVPGLAGAETAARARIVTAFGLHTRLEDAAVSSGPQAAVLVFGEYVGSASAASAPAPQLYDVASGQWHARPHWTLPTAADGAVNVAGAEADGWLVLIFEPLDDDGDAAANAESVERLCSTTLAAANTAANAANAGASAEDVERKFTTMHADTAATQHASPVAQLFVLDTARAEVGWRRIDEPLLGGVLYGKLTRAVSRERRLAAYASCQ